MIETNEKLVLQETICNLIIKLQEQERITEEKQAEAEKYKKWWFEDNALRQELQGILEGVTDDLMVEHDKFQPRQADVENTFKNGLKFAVNSIKTKIDEAKTK